MVEARLFQALSDATRLKILSLLARGPMNVSAMVSDLACAQPAVSRHLRVLRDVDLIRDERHGKEVEYSLNPGRVTDAAGYLEGLLGEMASEAGGGRMEDQGPSGTETRRYPGKGVEAGSEAKGPRLRSGDATGTRQAKPGKKRKAVGDKTPTPPEAAGGSEQADEPEYAIARKRDDGMDDFLL